MNDPFEILGLCPSFALPLETLNKAFREKISQAHPDAASGPCSESVSATEINEAYTLLKDSLARAEFLLTRLGFWPRVPAAQVLEALLEGKGSGEEKEDALAMAFAQENYPLAADLLFEMKHKRTLHARSD